MTEMSVYMKISEHACGQDYCLVEATGQESVMIHNVSFSFSLEYFFNFVLPEHRSWFLHQVAQQYLNSEVMRVYKQRQDFNYSIKNVDEAIAKCEAIRKKVIDSKV